MVMKIKILTQNIRFNSSTKNVYLISTPNKKFHFWFPVKLTFINFDVATLYVPNKTFYGFDELDNRVKLTALDIQNHFRIYANLRNSRIR